LIVKFATSIPQPKCSPNPILTEYFGSLWFNPS